MSNYFIGIRYNLGRDAFQAAVLSFSGNEFTFIAKHTFPLPESTLLAIDELTIQGFLDYATVYGLDTLFTEHLCHVIKELLNCANLTPQQVSAIGYSEDVSDHINHPEFSQLGDPTAISMRTGIFTFAHSRSQQLRKKEIHQLPEQLFLQQFLRSTQCTRCILSVNQLSNLTMLSADASRGYVSLDVGPGFALLDTWSLHHLGLLRDQNLRWTLTGTGIPTLIDEMLKDPYFLAPMPKFIHPSYFNLNWLNYYLSQQPFRNIHANVQRSLLELTAKTITSALARVIPMNTEIIIMGKAATNAGLIHCLQKNLSNTRRKQFVTEFPHAEWLEPAAMAWFAFRTLQQIQSNAHPDIADDRYHSEQPDAL